MLLRHALFLKVWDEKGDKNGWWVYECPTCEIGYRVMSRTILRGKQLEMHETKGWFQ